MQLEILVNHYNEDLDIVNRFLKSLSGQKGVEFQVLICSDGGGVKLTEDILSGYPFPIFYAYAPHRGVCHTRNILLDKSSADYVMFCDIDDEFKESDGLKALIDTALESEADTVGSPYYVERKNGDKFDYGILDKDVIRVHGKIFRRQYLMDNNIRYPDEMEISGDMSFLWLVYMLTDKAKWIDKNFYIWKWNGNSVTREKSHHRYRTYDKTLRCYTLLAEDLKKRNRPDLYANLVTTLFGMIYVDLTHPLLKTVPKEFRDHTVKSIRDFISVYYKDYKNMDRTLRYKSYDNMLRYENAVGVSGRFDDIFPFFNGFMMATTSEY